MIWNCVNCPPCWMTCMWVGLTAAWPEACVTTFTCTSSLHLRCSRKEEGTKFTMVNHILVMLNTFHSLGVKIQNNNPFCMSLPGRQLAHDIANFAKDSASTPVRVLGPADFPKPVTAGEEPWFVDFYAPWCPPCMRLLPEFRKVT